MTKVYLKNPMGYAIIGTGKPAQALPKKFEVNGSANQIRRDNQP
jgi:hypothetical protein